MSDSEIDGSRLDELQRILGICERQRRVERCVINSTGRTRKRSSATSSLGRSIASECPENIVHMKQLVQTLQRIDKEKKHTLSRLTAEREYWKIKYVDLLRNSNGASELEESFLLQPGFRYHANGDPRKMSLDALTNDLEKQLSELKATVNRVESKSGLSLSGTASQGSLESNNFRLLDSDSYRREIEATEKALREIKDCRELKAISKRVAKVHPTQTFLRARSGQPNASYTPELTSTTSFSRSDVKEKCRVIGGTHVKANCFACEYRLKQQLEDITAKKGPQKKGPRWMTAPRGVYLPGPSNLSHRNHGKIQKAASEVINTLSESVGKAASRKTTSSPAIIQSSSPGVSRVARSKLVVSQCNMSYARPTKSSSAKAEALTKSRPKANQHTASLTSIHELSSKKARNEQLDACNVGKHTVSMSNIKPSTMSTSTPRNDNTGSKLTFHKQSPSKIRASASKRVASLSSLVDLPARDAQTDGQQKHAPMMPRTTLESQNVSDTTFTKDTYPQSVEASMEIHHSRVGSDECIESSTLESTGIRSHSGDIHSNDQRSIGVKTKNPRAPGRSQSEAHTSRAKTAQLSKCHQGRQPLLQRRPKSEELVKATKRAGGERSPRKRSVATFNEMKARSRSHLANCSSKISEFLTKLPEPNVSIERWRSSTGVQKKQGCDPQTDEEAKHKQAFSYAPDAESVLSFRHGRGDVIKAQKKAPMQAASGLDSANDAMAPSVQVDLSAGYPASLEQLINCRYLRVSSSSTAPYPEMDQLH